MGRAPLAALLAAGCALVAGCRSRYAELPSDWGARAAAAAAEDEARARGDAPADPVDTGARLERRREYWEGDLERPRREWHQYVYPGGRTLRHGVERGWHANGALAYERVFDHGRRAGIWRRWYPDGARESELSYVDASRPATMTWWHPNGRVSSTGPALGGLRDGPWEHFDAQGRFVARGAYRAGKRHGSWVDAGEDGVERRSEWRDGVRVGPSAGQ